MSRKRHAQEGHANSERWLLTYADLITLLLVFFVVMYSISKADERKFAKVSASLSKAFNTVVLQGSDQSALGGELGPEGGNSLLEDLISLRTQIVKLSEGMDSPGNVGLAAEREGVALSLSASLLFDSGRADLSPESTKILDAVVDWLRRVPNEVRVEGHTDNVPVESDIYPTNWELSAARATVVTRYLVEVGRIEPQRLSAQGYGEYRPIADNDSRESRALNRRVIILIMNLNQSEEPPR